MRSTLQAAISDADTEDSEAHEHHGQENKPPGQDM